MHDLFVSSLKSKKKWNLNILLLPFLRAKNGKTQTTHRGQFLKFQAAMR